jgi:hypothetical protein
MGLNNTLKSVFGWGSEQNMDEIIRRGKWGLDGLVKFVTYFIEERGLSEGLFEGKLEFLMKELEKKSAMASTDINGTRTAATPTAEISDLVSTTNATSQTSAAQTLPAEDAIIDIDAMFEYEETRVKKHQKSMTACSGYTLTFPDGMSPHTAYPFALHDTLIVPWDYSVKNGTMVLFAQSCAGFKLSDGDAKRCQSCMQLEHNTMLEGIVSRIKNGAHENIGFTYLGFGGLSEMLHRKNQRIEFYLVFEGPV